MLLLHGLGCSSRWWSAVAASLEDARHVLLADLLGHGDSPLLPAGARVEDQADAVAAALSSRSSSAATVVGHSLGGLVAVALAQRYPATVDRLLLLSTCPSLSVARLEIAARLAFAPGLGPILWRVAGRRGRQAAARTLFAPTFEAPADLLDDLSRLGHRDLARPSRAGVRFWRERRVDRRIPEAVHTTAAFGSRDRTLDPEAAATQWSERHNAVLLPGVGHFPHVEAPDTVAQLILGTWPVVA